MGDVQKYQAFWGLLDIPDIFGGLTVDAGPKPTYEEKIRVPPWGGGTLMFSSYIGLGPASTVHPQKYQEFRAPEKKLFEILPNPKKYPPFFTFITLNLSKDPKMHRNEPLIRSNL